MLLTEFHKNCSVSYNDVLKDKTKYGDGGHLGNVTKVPQTNFCSPCPWRPHTKFSFD